jgi:hypothetical protein
MRQGGHTTNLPLTLFHQEKRSEVIYGNLNNLWTIIDIITLSPIA